MHVDYNNVFYQMTANEIDEANAALDLYLEALEESKGGEK